MARMALALIAPRWRAVRVKLTRADWTGAGLAEPGRKHRLLHFPRHRGAAGRARAAALIVGLLPVAISLIGTRDGGAVSAVKLVPSLVLAVAGVALISVSSLAATAASRRLAAARSYGLICAVRRVGLLDACSRSAMRAIARLPHVSSHDWSLLLGVVTGAQALLLAPAFLLSSQSHDTEAWLRLGMVSCAIALAGLRGGQCPVEQRQPAAAADHDRPDGDLRNAVRAALWLCLGAAACRRFWRRRAIAALVLAVVVVRLQPPHAQTARVIGAENLSFAATNWQSKTGFKP